MLISTCQNPHLSLPHTNTILIQPPLFSPRYPKTTQKPRKHIFLIRSSITRSENQALPQSAIQRIADKLRSLGFSETQNPEPESDSVSGSSSPGEIFVPLPAKLPKYRVGHTIDSSWSTPENPVPEPGSDPESLMIRFRDMKRERKKMGRVKKEEEEERAVPSLAELKLSAAELRRLRTVGIAEERKLKVGKAGITEGIVNGIHERWRKSEVVRIVCEDICKMNMKRTHEVLERKTGGLVVWRSGSKIILYRGANYQYPYFSADKVGTHVTSSNASSDTSMDDKEFCSSEFNGVKSSTPTATNEMTKHTIIQGVGSPSRVRFQLPGEAELVAEADRLLDGLGPRFTDWWGYEPLPVDGDLLPATVPGYRKPFRLLPYGVKPLLTNDEMTTLRRLGRPLPCHFALGRNRKLQGLAASVVKLWEKCEIAKIAVKRGVQNTNSLLMAEELKWLTGGTLLSRDKDFIVLYRGKDFLPSAVSSAIEERRKHIIHGENQMAKTMQKVKRKGTKIGSENDGNSAKDQKSNVFSDHKSMNHAEAAIRRTSSKLSMALEKKAKAEKLLVELEQEEIPQQSEIDKEGITREERYMLRKVGLRMKPFLLLGRRGVFAGTVENMHLHWKYRELVKIISKETNGEAVHKVAQILEAESGGILVAVERVSKGYAIIFYRGKNYERPTSLRPRTLLSKREAMKRSLEEQRRKSLKLHILKLTKNIDDLKNQLVVDEASSIQSADRSRLSRVKEETGTLQSVECARSDTERCVSQGGLLEAREKEGSESTSMKNNRMFAAVSNEQPSGQELTEPSSVHDELENHNAESEFSSDSVSGRKYNTQVEMPDSRSHHDNLMEQTVDATSNGPMESMVESANKNLDVLISPEVENVSNKMTSTAKFLSNKDRLLLRKQALNMKKRPVLAVGRSNVVTGLAKAINTHFRKHPLAIVNVKGRAKGTSVQEVVLKLQEATGAVLVSQEPSKVILYRGWGANDEPVHGDKKYVKDTSIQNQPAVSQELVAAIKFECGLQRQQEKEAP